MNFRLSGTGIITMWNNIDYRLIEAQVFKSMREANIIPASELTLNMDGQIHRFAVEGDRWGATSGAYKIYSDGWPHWFIQDFRKGNTMQHYSFDKNAIPAEDRLAYFRDNSINEQTHRGYDTEAQRQRQLLQRKKQEAEAEQAAILNAWKEYHYPCSRDFTPLHPYLQAKHVDNSHMIFFNGGHILRTKATETEGDICRKGELLIPLIHAETFTFSGLVRIFSRPNPEGKFKPKPFYKGTHPTACCCPLIPYRCMAHFDPTPERLRQAHPYRTQERAGKLEADSVFICEGIATAFAILEISENKYPVLAAMSAHNIIHVAKAWRKLYPHIRIIIGADNDNAGIEAANKTINAGYADIKIIPPIEGLDWNDYLTTKKGR